MARPLDAEVLARPGAGGGRRAERGAAARRWWRRFARNRGAVFGLAVFLAIVLMALFADVLAPYDPVIQGVGPANEGPSWAHWAGTDSFGRDMLSRIVYGARIALVVGIVAVLLAMIVGVTLGLVAGYYGGAVDAVIMRVMDGLFAFPIIILAIAMMAVMGFGVKNVIIAVAVGFIAPFARVTRADVLAVKEEPYVEAARLAGCRGPPSSRATCCPTCWRPSSCKRPCASPARSSPSRACPSSGSARRRRRRCGAP